MHYPVCRYPLTSVVDICVFFAAYFIRNEIARGPQTFAMSVYSPGINALIEARGFVIPRRHVLWGELGPGSPKERTGAKSIDARSRIDLVPSLATTPRRRAFLA